MKIVAPSVELVAITPDCERLIERAGRTCYRSTDRITESSHEPFIRAIIERGHESVLEHASATFEVVTDRAVMAEFTRHRHASFSVESTRYVNYKNGVPFVVPSGLSKEQECELKEFFSAVEFADRVYASLNIKTDLKRAILPNCTATVFIVSANLREWRHILKLRTHRSAHHDMRLIAMSICSILKRHAPSVFYDFK